MLGFGLKAKIFGLGLAPKTLALLSLALALYLLGLINITGTGHWAMTGKRYK